MAMLYFALTDGRVKIGMTENIRARLSSFKTNGSHEVTIKKVINGRKKGICHLERDLHKKFSHLRIKGEWFSYGDEICEFLKEVDIAERKYVTI